MKNPLVLSILLFVVALGAFGQDEHTRALELYKKGQFADAVVLLDESIAAHPDWYFPILLKGKCNLRLNKIKDALRNFNDALTLEIPSKDIPSTKYAIAQCYMKLQDYPKAIHAYTELLEIAPAGKKFDLYFSRGQCEMQVAQTSEESDFTKASSYYSKAIVSFSEALNSPTDDQNLKIESAYQKAFAQYKIGNKEGSITSLEKSIQAFEKVIALQAKEQRAHRFIITLGFEVTRQAPDSQKPGKYEAVVSYIDRFLQEWPNDPEMMNKKGLALQGAKKYQQAIDVFKLVAKLTPKDGKVFFSLASCEMADKRYKAAIDSFKKAIPLGEKDNATLYSYVAYCYQEQKTGCAQNDIPLYEDAVDILKKGIAAVSGPAKAALEKELNRKSENLNILRENVATDNQNHAASIENIKALSLSIANNSNKLERNVDMNLRQPTAELQQAIDEGKKTIKADQESLDKELQTMKKYVREAAKCGGAKSFTRFNDMQSILKEHGM